MALSSSGGSLSGSGTTLVRLWARVHPAFAVDTDEVGEYTPKLGTLTNAVSFGILVLTMVGAAGMMASMLMKEYTAGKGSTVRSRMVLFLVFGDFWLGLIGVIPTLATLTGNPPRMGTGFCNSMGFLLAVSIYVQHLNTLTLCVSTFLILIHPLSTATRILERHWRWLFPLPWVLACILCGIAWGTQGDWGYNNGLCFYKAGLFSEIWQFLPRCIVFLVISVLYVRLFVFLRRPDKIRSSTSLQGGSGSSTTGGQSTEVNTAGRRWSRWRFGSRSSSGFRASASEEQPSRWAGFTGRAARGSDGSNDQRRSRTEREPSAGGPKDLSLGPVRTSVSHPAATSSKSQVPPLTTAHYGLDSARSSMSGLGGSAAVAPVEAKKKRDIPAWEKLELPDYSKGLSASGDFSPPLSPRTMTTVKRGSASGWKWGMGGSQSFGGVEGEDMISSSDGPTPSQLPRRSTLAPLKIPHPAPPAQPAIRRTPSFVNANAVGPSAPPPQAVASSSRRPSAQGSDGESAGGANSDGRLLDFPFASLRRGSHVSFSFADGPSSTGTPTNARTHTPPPTLPELPQTFGGPEPGQSISSTAGASTPFSGFSFASQGTTVQAPLLSPQHEVGEGDSPPVGPGQHRFSDASAGSGVDPRTPLAPPPTDLPPIILTKDASSGASSSAETSNATTSDTRRDSAATGASDKNVEFVGVKRLLSDFQEDGLSPGDNEDGHLQSDDEGVEYSLAKILECSAPPDDYDYYDGGMGTMTNRGEGSSGEVGSGTGSSSDGRNQESMSKFMNRKASLLMLTFPLAYIVLFTVSLIRIIYDFAHPEPIPALSAVSRWLVFSQGLVDALIYGIIEWRVKRTVRRRTRKIQSASGGEDSRGGMTGVTGSTAGMTTMGRASHSTTWALRHGNRPSQGASSLP